MPVLLKNSETPYIYKFKENIPTTVNVMKFMKWSHFMKLLRTVRDHELNTYISQFRNRYNNVMCDVRHFYFFFIDLNITWWVSQPVFQTWWSYLNIAAFSDSISLVIKLIPVFSPIYKILQLSILESRIVRNMFQSTIRWQCFFSF